VSIRKDEGYCVVVERRSCGVAALSLDGKRGYSDMIHRGGELGSTGLDEVSVACRGWSAGHVKSRPKISIAESNLALAA
jgi:hypothetical protein